MAGSDPLAERYRSVMDRVAEGAARRGRRPDEVLTVLVTKQATEDQIRHVIQLGHLDFGENRMPQLRERVEAAAAWAGERPLRWHMVGHLQRNKAAAVLPLVRLIHSVDTLRLAEEIEQQAARSGREVEVLLQVNVSRETSKFGVAPPALRHLADQFRTLRRMRLRGLMTIAPLAEDPEASRPHFERLEEFFAEMRATGDYGDRFNILSMGMSNDFEVAIACGANMIRVGRAVFGDAE